MQPASESPKERPLKRLSGHQLTADLLTVVCMGTTGFLVLFAILGPQEGMEALAIIIPWMIAVAAHFILSLPAFILAWKTGRHLRNSWLYAYFLIFWGFHTVYFVQINEIDAAFMRQVHRFTRPADTELYYLVTERTLRNRNSPPLDMTVRERVLALIEQGANIHYRPPGKLHNRGPLIIAAVRSGEPRLVAALLDHGASVEGPGRGGQTPLMEATRLGHSAVVATLLKRGANPDDPRYRPASPLIEAVRKQDLKTAAVLLQAGAGPDHHPRDSAAPLFYASSKGDAPMLKLLLDAGADPNQLFFQRGTSAMIGAVETGCTPCVRHLLSAGGRPVGVNSRGAGVMSIVLERGLDDIAGLLREALESQDATARKAVGVFSDIYRAVEIKQWDRLKTLMEMGVDPNLTNRRGQTALSLLAARKVWREVDTQAEITAGSLLIKFDAALDKGDPKGRTPLWHTSRSGATELAQLLIAGGADINQATADGVSPLYNALRKGHTNMAAVLLAAGADPNARTNWGMNSDYPLKIAASRGQADTVRLLLDNGAAIQAGTRDLCDLLQRAAKHPQTVKVLAESGVDLNRKDPLGRYPLVVVMRRGEEESIRFLLNAGAYPMITDWRGHQPLHWFAETGQVAALRLALEKYENLRTDRPLLKQTLYRSIRKGQVASVRELLKHGTFYTRMAEVEAVVKWTKPPPAHPRAKAEILALFKQRLGAQIQPSETRSARPILKVVPRTK